METTVTENKVRPAAAQRRLPEEKSTSTQTDTNLETIFQSLENETSRQYVAGEKNPNEHELAYAFNKGWQGFLFLYEGKNVRFLDQFRLAKIQSLIEATLKSNKAEHRRKWILLEACQICIEHAGGGGIKKGPFLKHAFFLSGTLFGIKPFGGSFEGLQKYYW